MTKIKLVRPKCPECQADNTIKNGTMAIWKARKKSRVQMYRCNSCGRQFREPRLPL